MPRGSRVAAAAGQGYFLAVHPAPQRWLLLRGMAREARHWFEFPEVFRQSIQRPAVALDLPGVGSEWTRNSPLGIELIAADVAKRLAQTQPEADVRWGVLGLSLGGMVALALGAAYPSRFTHLVVVNASSRLNRPDERLQPRAALTLLAVAREGNALARERLIYALTSNLPGMQRERCAALSAGFSECQPTRRRTALRQLAAASRFTPPSSIAQASLILGSRGDRMVSSRCSRRLALCYGMPYREHAYAGHELTLDDPAWVTQQVASWLAALG